MTKASKQEPDDDEGRYLQELDKGTPDGLPGLARRFPRFGEETAAVPGVIVIVCHSALDECRW